VKLEDLLHDVAKPLERTARNLPDDSRAWTAPMLAMMRRDAFDRGVAERWAELREDLVEEHRAPLDALFTELLSLRTQAHEPTTLRALVLELARSIRALAQRLGEGR
jgi:ribosomal protein L29